ncbi:uncharacterized protein METZ01_LOCUS266270, partial [marine metagenome]
QPCCSRWRELTSCRGRSAVCGCYEVAL